MRASIALFLRATSQACLHAHLTYESEKGGVHMHGDRVESYLGFMDYLEYPMVLFEKESGRVIKLNYEAQMFLGKEIEKIHINQDTFHAEDIFSERLEHAKSLLWYRILLEADGKSYFVSGIINVFTDGDTEYCALMFESRADLQRGSVTLERMINRSGYVALYYYPDGDMWKPRYVSQNIKKFGYTSEQFYRGIIGIRDLMTAEDYQQMRGIFKQKADAGEEAFSLNTYWISENQEKYYVRMDMHYDKDQYGKITGLDFLIHDLSREQKESEENQYLKTAINKSQSVVLVNRYKGGKRYLRFISPNAAILGCNVDALIQGNRLSEDYIHPDDRDEVLDGVYKAIANSQSGYVQTYRMVGDDGACRYVKSEITLSHLSDTEANVEFLITDITEEKEYEKELLKQKRDHEQEIDFIMKGYEKANESFDVMTVLSEGFMDELIEAFVEVTGLYSVVIDLQGGFITKPAGGVAHMGEFYDLFERPFYKELYHKLNTQLIAERQPVALEMKDGNPYSRIAGAPIMMDDRHVATWIICAFSKKERDSLLNVYRAQYSLSEHVSEYLFNEAVVDKEIKRSRLNEHRLKKQLEGQNIITELLVNMQDNTMYPLGSILEKVGRYLDVGRISCFALDEKTKVFNCLMDWDCRHKEGFDTPSPSWNVNVDPDVMKQIRMQDFLVLSDRQCRMDIRQILEKYGLKTVLMVPILYKEKVIGYLTCGEHRRHRVWQDSEIQFVKRIRDIIETIAGAIKNQSQEDLRSMTSSLVSVYDYCPQIIYVRDAVTCEIYYANKAAEEAFGMLLEGEDSNQIVRSPMSDYEHSPAMRKRFVHNKNVAKWECYIKQLDKIMHVEEIRIEWYEHKDARLVGLKE